MKTKIVKVNYGMTYNLGNYQSMRIDVGEEIEIGNEDPDTVIAIRYKQLKRLVDEELHHIDGE